MDFIHVHHDGPILCMDRFDYPTFNVADIVIFIGVVLLVLDGMRPRRGPTDSRPRAAEASV